MKATVETLSIEKEEKAKMMQTQIEINELKNQYADMERFNQEKIEELQQEVMKRS